MNNSTSNAVGRRESITFPALDADGFPLQGGVYKIGPEQAERWECLNHPENRKKSAATIKKYADIMKAGRWPFTHQGFAFDVDRHMVDGYTRTQSILRSGATIVSRVEVGLPAGSLRYIDVGRGRRASQFMKIPYATVIHAAYGDLLFAQACKDGGGKVPESFASLKSGDVDTILTGIEAWPELEKLAPTVQRIYQRIGYPRTPLLAVLAQASRGRYADRIEEFVRGLETGADLPVDSPVLRLRNRPDGLTMGTARSYKERVVRYGVTAKAWGHHALGEQVKCLKFTYDTRKADLEEIDYPTGGRNRGSRGVKELMPVVL